MSRLSKLFGFARYGEITRVSAAPQRSAKAIKRNVQGAILGLRTLDRSIPSKRLEEAEINGETVLNALLELTPRRPVVPLSELTQYLRSENPSRLGRVLQDMYEECLIQVVQMGEHETGVRWTMKGAVTALYGDWLMDRPSSGSLARGRKAAACAPQVANSPVPPAQHARPQTK